MNQLLKGTEWALLQSRHQGTLQILVPEHKEDCAGRGHWLDGANYRAVRIPRAERNGAEPCHYLPVPALHSKRHQSHHVWHQTLHVWQHRAAAVLSHTCTGGMVVAQTSPTQAGEQVRARAPRIHGGCWARKRRELPLLEVCIEDPIGEPFTADADAFKDTVTAQLVQHQEGIHGSCG